MELLFEMIHLFMLYPGASGGDTQGVQWQKEAKDNGWAMQSNAMVEEGAVLVAVQWRTSQAVRAWKTARWQQQMQELSE